MDKVDKLDAVDFPCAKSEVALYCPLAITVA
jgi:hypothetical protein